MAGAGYKLFNTGDVLTAAQVNTYLMEQTVMRFATTSARDTALSGVLAEGMIAYIDADNNLYKYTGSAWVNIDSGSTSPLTTKGDLYTYSTTDARLGVGSNGDSLVADSAATTGLRYQPGNGLAQGVINGGMDIWQRGTSFTGTSPYYSADRFNSLRATAAPGATFSRQTSGLTGFQYSIRSQRNSGNTGTDAVILAQCLESANSYQYAGQPVVLSFWAKCGANYSSASSALTSQIRYGTGTDQNYILSSYTGDTQVATATHTLTTSWQRFFLTGTVNSAATEVGFDLRYTPVGTASTNDWFEVTGIQLELGTVPTAFRRAGGDIQGEIAACQRYYYRITANATSNQIVGGNGMGSTTTAARLTQPLPVRMRVAPTVLDYSGWELSDSAGGNVAITGLTFDTGMVSTDMVTINSSSSSGVTVYRPYNLRGTSSTSYIGFGAEL